MPSSNMLPKGKRRHTVKPAYRAARDAAPEVAPIIPLIEEDDSEDGILRFDADAAAAGMRVDQYLAKCLPDISRARVQLLIEHGQVRINGDAAKAKHKLTGGEEIEIEGQSRPEPLRAIAEDIPLDIIYEDASLAVINKPAGMMVHAGAGSVDDARNRGTLVNALLHHFQSLSGVGGDLRPGIVHRLDKQTSGLILVAKNDSTHRKLSEIFAARQLRKTYLALVHGNIAADTGTIDTPISRDLVRRTRMTTRRAGGRTAVSHYMVLQRFDTRYGKFTLLEVRIETGRTHQIRVHLASLGHPVVGDTLYGAPHAIPLLDKHAQAAPLTLPRNFLHAARLEFTHPQTAKPMSLEAPLPGELNSFLNSLQARLTSV